MTDVNAERIGAMKQAGSIV